MPSPAGILSVADIARAGAAEWPDSAALRCEGRETTFSALDRRASQVANGLLGMEGSGPVAVLDANSDTFFEVLFGTAKANRPLVPINWRLTPPEVGYILQDAGVRVLFVGAEFFPCVEAIRRHCSTIVAIIALSGAHDEWEPYVAWRDRQRDSDPALAAGASDAGLHLYTSGTTGTPRAVRLTNRNILAGAPALSNEFGRATERDVALVCLPLFHVSGSLWALGCLYAGATCVVLPTIDPAGILDAIGTHRVTRMFLVPAIIRLLVQAEQIHAADLSSLQLVVYGASPIPVPLLRAALDTFTCQFAQVYGLTETCGAITCLRPADHDPALGARLHSCGKPLAGVDIRVLDDQGRVAPPGTVGEIVCRTAQNIGEYWNRPEDTAGAFRGEWLRTGDAGYLDADGYLYIHDRIKDMIITGGENVYPAEVENALIGHPAIADVAVIGIPDERWGEAVTAFVVVRPGQRVSEAEVVRYSKARIARYKAPKTVRFVEVLPRNASGKLLKQELRAPYWAGHARAVN